MVLSNEDSVKGWRLLNAALLIFLVATWQKQLSFSRACYASADGGGGGGLTYFVKGTENGIFLFQGVHISTPPLIVMLCQFAILNAHRSLSFNICINFGEILTLYSMEL